MRTPRQTKAAAGLRITGAGLAPALRTRTVERLEKPMQNVRAAPPITGPGGVPLKASNVTGADVVLALGVGHGSELGTVEEWLGRNGYGANRRAGLEALFRMHRAGTIGFRAAEV